MLKEIRNGECTKCALHKGCDHVCRMYLEESAVGGMMVVGDYGDRPDKTPAAMRDAKFELFWNMLLKVVKADENRVYATYLAKCEVNPNIKPTELEYLTCASVYIKKEIFAIRPKVIILLGAAPMAAFGFTGALSSIAGQPQQFTITKVAEVFTTTVIITQSPGYYHYHPNELKTFATHIDKAWKIATGITADTESPTKVTLCTTMKQVRQVIKYILQTKQCSFDFENTLLKHMGVYDPNFKATLLAVSFQHGSAYTIPLWHFESPFTNEEVMHILGLFSKYVWSNSEIHKINQNIKYDMNVAARYGFDDFRGRLDCTMVMHSLVDDLTKHSIKVWLPTIFPQFLGWELEVKGQAWDRIPLKTLSNYAGVDADGALRGYTALLQLLLKDQRVYDLYRNLYMFALRPLFRMERRGMPISRENIVIYEARALELIQEQRKKLNNYISVANFCKAAAGKAAEDKLAELRARKAKAKGKNLAKVVAAMNDIKTGRTQIYKGFNFGSPDQLCELLYSKHGFGFKVPYDKKTRGPKEATGSEVVKQLGDKSGFIDDLLVYRSLQTIHSKYLKGIRIQMDSNDCVHTTYNQANVKTGRLSSGGKNSGPNLQNIITHVKIHHPFVEELTGLPKKAFIVPKGKTLINIDFSQAELRMMAEFAKVKKMIDAYNSGKDLHILTACVISKLTEVQYYKLPEKERKELRQKAKAANFGLIYGQEAEGFKDYARDKYGVDMTLAEATRIRNAFFEEYPEILDYHDTYQAKCKRYGYVRTLFGRKAHYPDINLPDGVLKGNAERELINMPIQGSNGENTVFALSLLELRLPQCVLINNTVHDSIMMLAPHKYVAYAIKVAIDTCENVPQLQFFGKEMKLLKMKADAQYSLTNWKELKDYSEDAWRADMEAV